MSLNKVVLSVHSKINLILNVYERAFSGLHKLESVVIPTPIFDEVTITGREDKVINVQYSNNMHFDNDNVLKIAKLIQEKFLIDGVDIYIEKNIPIGAGLGGSSANAGAVAKGLKQLYKLDEIPVSLLLSVGSDVAYMYHGGTKIIKGCGEIILPIQLDPRCVCILFDDISTSTANVYKIFDKVGGSNYPIKHFLETGIMSNALEKAALIEEPRIQKKIDILASVGFENIIVTGSGSAVIATSFEKDKFNEQICMLAKPKTPINILAYHYASDKLNIIYDSYSNRAN